jgi:TadE-like protein
MKFRFRDNRGSALVELAFVTPIFLTIITGTFELGRIAYYAIEVQSASRAGASYGSVNYGNAFSSNATIQQAAKDDAPDIPNLVVNSPYTYCVCETVDTTTTPPTATFSGALACTDPTIIGCTAESSTSVQLPIDYIKVDTQATIDPLIHLPGLPLTYTLYGSTRLRVLQN